MPLSYSIEPDHGLVTITGDYGEPADWRAMLTAVARDPAYRAGFSFIRDLRSSEHPVTSESVMGIIGVVREFWERLGVHRAAIVTRREIDIPAVVAQALAEEERLPLRVFNSYSDAARWVRER